MFHCGISLQNFCCFPSFSHSSTCSYQSPSFSLSGPSSQFHSPHDGSLKSPVMRLWPPQEFPGTASQDPSYQIGGHSLYPRNSSQVTSSCSRKTVVKSVLAHHQTHNAYICDICIYIVYMRIHSICLLCLCLHICVYHYKYRYSVYL